MYRNRMYNAKLRREYQAKERKHRMMSMFYTTLFSPISIVLDKDTFKVVFTYGLTDLLLGWEEYQYCSMIVVSLTLNRGFLINIYFLLCFIKYLI